MARRRTSRKAWVKQKAKDVENLGADNAPWYCEHYAPNGKRRAESFGPGRDGKRAAQHAAKTITAELVSASYDRPDDVPWSKFIEEHESSVIARKKNGRTRTLMKKSLRKFTELCSPRYVADVNSKMIEEFVAKRSKQDGRAEGSIISAASINLDLRNIRAALNKAVDWEYLAKVPKITFEREYFKEPRVIEPEHFAAMFEACETARMPVKVAGITPVEWWHGLLALLAMTGWRIGEALRLKRGDVDLEKRTALTRAEDNKGKRDFRTPLHPVVVDWMMPLFVSSAGEQVFPWLGIHNTRTLYVELGRIQADAWVVYYKKLGNAEPPRDKTGKIIPAWPLYGFHDFRRTFATANADNLTGDMLQQLMRHQSPMTTERYKHSTKQRRLVSAADVLFTPDVLKQSAEVET